MSFKPGTTLVGMILAAAVLVWLAAPVTAEEKPWWPFKVVDSGSGQAKVVDYVPPPGEGLPEMEHRLPVSPPERHLLA